MTLLPDDELAAISRAIKLYAQRCERNAVIYQQPSADACSVEYVAGAQPRVVLRNIDGVLAVFAVKSNKPVRLAYEGTEYVAKRTNHVLEERAKLLAEMRTRVQ